MPTFCKIKGGACACGGPAIRHRSTLIRTHFRVCGRRFKRARQCHEDSSSQVFASRRQRGRISGYAADGSGASLSGPAGAHDRRVCCFGCRPPTPSCSPRNSTPCPPTNSPINHRSEPGSGAAMPTPGRSKSNRRSFPRATDARPSCSRAGGILPDRGT
jgi:hypothetical protein